MDQNWRLCCVDFGEQIWSKLFQLLLLLLRFQVASLASSCQADWAERVSWAKATRSLSSPPRTIQLAAASRQADHREPPSGLLRNKGPLLEAAAIGIDQSSCGTRRESPIERARRKLTAKTFSCPPVRSSSRRPCVNIFRCGASFAFLRLSACYITSQRLHHDRPAS